MASLPCYAPDALTERCGIDNKRLLQYQVQGTFVHDDSQSEPKGGESCLETEKSLPPTERKSLRRRGLPSQRYLVAACDGLIHTTTADDINIGLSSSPKLPGYYFFSQAPLPPPCRRRRRLSNPTFTRTSAFCRISCSKLGATRLSMVHRTATRLILNPPTKITTITTVAAATRFATTTFVVVSVIFKDCCYHEKTIISTCLNYLSLALLFLRLLMAASKEWTFVMVTVVVAPHRIHKPQLVLLDEMVNHPVTTT